MKHVPGHGVHLYHRMLHSKEFGELIDTPLELL
jgi:hypothetical protein